MKHKIGYSIQVSIPLEIDIEAGNEIEACREFLLKMINDYSGTLEKSKMFEYEWAKNKSVIKYLANSDFCVDPKKVSIDDVISSKDQELNDDPYEIYQDITAYINLDCMPEIYREIIAQRKKRK